MLFDNAMEGWDDQDGIDWDLFQLRNRQDPRRGRPVCLPEWQPVGTYSGEHTGSPLHQVIQWFKTMTTNEYIRGVKQRGWAPFPGKLWQRNYYEHIVRNEKELIRIAIIFYETSFFKIAAWSPIWSPFEK